MARTHEFAEGFCVHCTRPENQKQMACRLPKGAAKPEPTYTAKITSSLIAAIIDCSPSMKYSQALRILVRKEIGEPDEFQSNVTTEYNAGCFETALGEYKLTHECVEESPDAFVSGHFSVRPWMTFDHTLDSWGLLVIRTPYGKRNSDEFEPAEHVDHLWARVQFDLLVTGLPWADVVQWSHAGMRVDRIEPEPDFAARIQPAVDRIIKDFKAGLKSPKDFIEDAVPEIDTKEARNLAKEWDDMLDAEQKVKDRKEELMESIRKLAKDKPSVVGGKRLIRTESAGSVQYAKLVSKYLPDLTDEQKAEFTGSPKTSWSIK